MHSISGIGLGALDLSHVIHPRVGEGGMIIISILEMKLRPKEMKTFAQGKREQVLNPDLSNHRLSAFGPSGRVCQLGQ